MPSSTNRARRLPAHCLQLAGVIGWVVCSLGAGSTTAEPKVQLVPHSMTKSVVGLERIPNYPCPFPLPDPEEICGSELERLSSRQLEPFGRITVYALNQTRDTPAASCWRRKILVLSQRSAQTRYWSLDVPDEYPIDARASLVPAGKTRLLWVELQGPFGRKAFVFGLDGDRMSQLVSALPLGYGTAGQLKVDFPSPTKMRIAARTAALEDEQKKWLGSRQLSPAPKSDGTPIEMRIDYPGVDVCDSERGKDDTTFTVGKPTPTKAFGNLSVHTAAQGPEDSQHTVDVFLVSEGAGRESVIPIHQLISARTETSTLSVRRLEEIRPGGRPFLWIEADLCQVPRKGADFSREVCDRVGYLLDRDAKGLLRYRAYAVPLIVPLEGGAKGILEVRFPDAHSMTVTGGPQEKLTEEQQTWRGKHELP